MHISTRSLETFRHGAESTQSLSRQTSAQFSVPPPKKKRYIIPALRINLDGGGAGLFVEGLRMLQKPTHTNAFSYGGSIGLVNQSDHQGAAIETRFSAGLYNGLEGIRAGVELGAGVNIFDVEAREGFLVFGKVRGFEMPVGDLDVNVDLSVSHYLSNQETMFAVTLGVPLNKW